MSATADPVIPEKNISETMTVWASPPRRLLTRFPANRTIFSVRLARFMISPVMMKNGMASRT